MDGCRIDLESYAGFVTGYDVSAAAILLFSLCPPFVSPSLVLHAAPLLYLHLPFPTSPPLLLVKWTR